MHIENIMVVYENDHINVSAQIGPYPLWFKFNNDFLIDPNDATCFLSNALIPAMLLGEDIVVSPQYHVSQKLLKHITKIQDVFNFWNPIFKKINITATSKILNNDAAGCGSFFSGGVDGSYTLLKYKKEIEYLILINGFDFNMDTDTWKAMVTRTKKTATLTNKQLITVETNFKEFTSNFGLSRFSNFGSNLASISQLLNLKRCFISAADTFDHLFPSGSHVQLDYLWSTETCKIEHVGLEANRKDKLFLIKNEPNVLANLWVCWEDPKVNCGKCSKCIRTFVSLLLCNIDDFPFQQPILIKDVSNMIINGSEELLFVEQFFLEAKKQNIKALTWQLAKLIFKLKSKLFLKDMDRYLFNSVFENWKRRKIAISDDMIGISVLPRYTDHYVCEEVKLNHLKQKCHKSQVGIGTIFIEAKTSSL
ncbi:hypothetical protein ESZ36_05225 [Colwellia demingiae]|uniref:Uncharacterized protein n=1 Tax=Colwellia demingiae TaxID=89401 RepID=A0A5C6QPQ2_9GAMM|nr:hypothetical protein [Colwellia demingiae]TWX71035.1 hypothetical protein ESZ36_05225 [Colwellia demingiae]